MQHKLTPAFKSNNIPVLFSTDNKYVPYFSVAVKSLIENTIEDNNYDIIILSQDLSELSKKKLSSLKNEKNNVSIRFYDMHEYIENSRRQFFLNSYLPIETYYKFFLPDLMGNYDKCLYLDGDIAILDDVAELYHINIGSHPLGASLNVANINSNNTNPDEKIIGDYTRKEYFSGLLKMKNPDKYFQAGVLICNLKKMREIGYTEACLKKFDEIKTPRFFDQCVLNSLYSENYHCFSTEWNHVWYIQNPQSLKGGISEKLYKEFLLGRENPKIVHFASPYKPYHKPEWDLSEYFWKYARLTPYYEEILYKNMQKNNQAPTKSEIDLVMLKDCLNIQKLKKRYQRYRLLSNLTFGKIRKKYNDLRKIYKSKLKNIKAFLKNKNK